MSPVCVLVLYISHSFRQFGTIQETERAKLSLFHQSQSLSLSLSPSLSLSHTHTHTHTHTRIRKHHEQLSGQLIQFYDSAIS